MICHNANCVEPTDPADDDTLAALGRSLALELAGAPVLDGVELDTFFRAEDGACLFAHDLDAPRTELASEAADAVAAHVAGSARLAASGGPFFVFIELKAHVAPSKDVQHSPEQRRRHAACAWDAYARIATAATANGRAVEIVFSSFQPMLLREVIDQTPAAVPVPFRLEAFYGIPRPLGETRPLDEYAGLPITLIAIHPHWIHDAQHEGVLSNPDVTLEFWMFSATVETFAALEQYEPELVGTSEAMLLRRWLDY